MVDAAVADEAVARTVTHLNPAFNAQRLEVGLVYQVLHTIKLMRSSSGLHRMFILPLTVAKDSHWSLSQRMIAYNCDY